jgi:hypothetical protein
MYSNINHKVILLLIIFLGSYLCFIGGYGSDEDTLPMIGTFLNMMNGNFMTSRFTGYPVAEFIIGFSSYHFGSAFINIIVFLSFIFGSAIFFYCLEKKFDFNKTIFFLLILISNPILFFDNLEPVDYSLSFLFFSLGFLFLVKKKIELAVVFFGICIGTRINFAPFIIVLISLNNIEFLQDRYRKISIIISSLFIGCLFYLPVWIESGLGFDWLRAGRPSGGLIEYLARFFYKVFFVIGGIQFLIILFVIFKKKYLVSVEENLNLIFYLILVNLLIFFYIPAELSYLQPFLIFIYYLVLKKIDKRFVFLLIFFNLISWMIQFQPINILYKYKNKCDPIVAIGVEIKPKLARGHYFDFLKNRSKINCWIDIKSEYGLKISNGEPLK